MSWLRYWRRKQRDADLSSEIEAYLAQEIEDNIARGIDPVEAGWAARRKFGNVTQIKETVRQMNTIEFLETVWQDARYAARQMRLEPGFFVVAILCLALGMGANTAIFSLLDVLRLRALPVESPEQLVEVRIAKNEHCCGGSFTTRRPSFTSAQWDQIRLRQQGFSSLFAWADQQFDLAAGGEGRYAEVLWVSGDFFTGLGVAPLIGRALSSEDDRPGCGAGGAVIGYSFWQREFGGAPDVIGKTARLDGHSFNVVGVMPASFFGVEVGRTFDIAVPLCAEPIVSGENSNTGKRNHWWLAAIGRLKPGWSVARADAQLKAVSHGVFETTVPPNTSPDGVKYYVDSKLTVVPAGSGVSSLRGQYQEPLLILLGIAGIVLLIACANLANLMLARASAREREIAVRLALGASRARLIRQLFAESLLLAIAGALLGALLAQALSRYLLAFLTTSNNPLFAALGFDWLVFAFTAALAVVTCILFGLTPAIRATRTSPGAVMKVSSRGLTAGRERFGLRRALVVSQVALSLVLLVGALLFVRSLRNLLTLDAGFQSEGLMIVQLDVMRLNFTPARRRVLYREILDRIRATPGVQFAASTVIVPISGSGWNNHIEFPGGENPRSVLTNFSEASAGYFRTLGTPLLTGRDFDEHDAPESPKVAIVNEAFSRRFLNGTNPVGIRIREVVGPGEPERAYQIVGLTRDAKYRGLRDDFSPTVFLAASQNAETRTGANILVRSRASIEPLLASLKRTIGEVNPNISIVFEGFQTQVDNSLIRERLMATLSGGFGFLAAVLAGIGLFGVISYMVAQRRKEIGIRMALGADRGKVLGLILGEAAVLLGIGLLIGIALSLAAARTAATLLYGLKPNDPATIGLGAILLAAVALPASFLPAHRASRADPMSALREE